jgi:hypothetical protein
MRWYWWVWVLLMWWMLFGCGDPAPVYVNVEEKPSYPTVGAGGERDTSIRVRIVAAPSLSRERGERDSNGDRRD